MSLIGVFHRYTYIFHGYSGILVVFRYFGDSCDPVMLHNICIQWFTYPLVLLSPRDSHDWYLMSPRIKSRVLYIFLCSPKNFGGAYSRRFVRASVRLYVRVSVRPCVRPALVHANSRKLLVGFQWNFMGILSIKGGCAYHLRVLVRWFFQELLPFDEFCMNI